MTSVVFEIRLRYKKRRILCVKNLSFSEVTICDRDQLRMILRHLMRDATCTIEKNFQFDFIKD